MPGLLLFGKGIPMTPRFGLALVCGLLLLPGIGHAEEDSFDSNGVKIHYHIEGKGEPVLLVHGFAVDAHAQWGLPGILKALAKDYRVIAPDLRGHGKSGKPSGDKQYGTEMVEDLVRLLDHLKIKKVHVVGYSMGALVAGKLLATHPERLLSATLGGAGAIPEGTKLPAFVDKLAESLENGKGLGPLLIALTPPGQPKPTLAAIQAMNLALVGNDSKVLAAVVRSWKTLKVPAKQLKDNKVPTLAIIGDKDPLKEIIDLLKDRMSNLKIEVIEGGDHVSTFMNPEFVRLLRSFLKEHSQKKATKPSEPRPGGSAENARVPAPSRSRLCLSWLLTESGCSVAIRGRGW
jgi:pimeloyl-ACP methyl ester carboxylesterase